MLGKRIISALLALVLLLGNVPVAALAAEKMPLEAPVVLTEEVAETTVLEASAPETTTVQTSPPETAAPTQVLEIPELETTAAAEEILVPVVLCDHGKEMASCNLCSGIQLTADDGTTVTRAEWLRQLTVTFEMAIEEGHYPDNYFSDLPSDSAYYYDVLLAVEFGVVDIPAGGAVRPEDPTTREFAAQTLNYCLGFQFEGTSYTFSDAALCTYPDDAQIAIDREWFALMDGAFCPEASITTAEMEIMLADAAQIYATQEIDPEFESSYVFADYVIEYPYGTDVEIDENGIVTLYNVEQVLSSGDTFVVYPTELPALYKAVSVSGDASVLTVTTTEADEDSAVVSINAEGTVDMDISQFEAGEGVEAMYIQNEADIALAENKFGITVSPGSVLAEVEVELSNKAKVKVLFKISDIKVNTKIDTLHDCYYVTVSGDTTLTGSVIKDAVKESDSKTILTLGKARMAGIGEVNISVELALNGKLSMSFDGDFEVGVQKDSSGFRMVKTFHKNTFSVVVEAKESFGIQVAVKVDIIAVEVKVYFTTGLEGKVSSKTYSDGKLPLNCTSIEAWWFFKAGISASTGLGKWKKTIRIEHEVFDEKNSPARVSFHCEDLVKVSACTRGKTSYITSDDSPYGSSSNGEGSSTGTDSNGNKYTIYTYSVSENNATITGYHGKTSVLEIPEILDGYTVTAIGSSAFYENTSLYAVILPDTVTTIGGSAFRRCINLQTILMPNRVTSLGEYCFADCSSLRSITIPNKLTSMGEGCFFDCSSLASITIPNGIYFLKDYLFSGCDSLTRVTIPDSVVAIGDECFRSCTSLISISIPDSVERIGRSAFENCTSLKNVKLPSLSLDKISGAMFSGCTSLEEIDMSMVLKPPATYVANSDDLIMDACVFSDCTALKKVKLPEFLKAIKWRVFENCSSLTEIIIPSTVTEIGDFVFKGCDSLVSVTIPPSVINMDSYAKGYPDSMTIYGVDGSYAQRYAETNSIPFVAIKGPQTPKITSAVRSLDMAKLTWSPVAGAEKYLVYRNMRIYWDRYEVVAVTDKCSYTGFAIEGSDHFSIYYGFYIVALSKNGIASAPSSTVVPSPGVFSPTGLKVVNVAVSGKNKISWNEVDEASKYQVWCSTTGKAGSFKLLVTTANLTHTHKAGIAGVKYYYKVKAIQGDKNSAFTGVYMRTCDLARPNVTASNVASTGKIKLSWPKVAGAVKYEIWRSATKNGTYARISTIKGTSFVATGTNAGKAYYYKVKAIHSNANANSAFSLPDLRTCDLPRPVVTAGNNATTGKVRLTWKAVTGASKYQVWYSATGKANTFKCVWTTKNLYFNHNASKVGVKGYYKVKAIHTNTAANSAYSTVVSRAAK